MCKKTFPSKDALRNHKRGRRCPKVRCLKCGETFSNRTIHQHILDTHNQAPGERVEKGGDGEERGEDREGGEGVEGDDGGGEERVGDREGGEGDDGDGGDWGEEGVGEGVGRGESEGEVIDFVIGGHPTDLDDLGDLILGELGGVEKTLPKVLDSVDEFGRGYCRRSNLHGRDGTHELVLFCA